MDSTTKLKNILVSACREAHAGNPDIASNLMEIASELMLEVDPETIETQFVLASKVGTLDEASEEDANDATETDDDHEEVDEAPAETAHASFRDIIKGWNFTNENAAGSV